jgi:hypothetical protein
MSLDLIIRTAILPALCTLVLIAQPIFAQTEVSQTSRVSLCSRENAVETIREQIDLTKTFNNSGQRIEVLIRAADLLWPLQQAKARTTFNEAFEFAVQNEKEKLEQSKGVRPSGLLMETPDQRFVVIRAVAKRDSALAKMLAARLVKAERQDQLQKATADSANDVLIAQKLLTSATQLVPLDFNTSLELARTSLRYPASFMLARFLYEVAAINQPVADSFYNQALAVYGNRPMREFLYLATYPFAFRSSGDTPVSGFYNDVVTANFKPTNSLQRRFVETLLRRSQQALEVPLDQGDDFNDFPGLAHVAQVLLRIEPEVTAALPDMLQDLIQTREKILVSLSLEVQGQLRPPESNASPTPSKTFEEQIAEAEKVSNPDKRYQLFLTTILSASSKEEMDVVFRAVDKIDDVQVRGLLRDWFYFSRALDAIKDRRMEEAETITSKIEMLEPRTYLKLEIAKELLNATESHSHAREVLEEAIMELSKARKTLFAARMLFTASNLYLKIDLNRSISVLTAAIETTNKLDVWNFQADGQALVKDIKGKNFRRFVRFYLPGLDPESALREVAKVDFDVALSQTIAFIEKFQRGMTTLAVMEVCLQKPQRSPTKARGQKVQD